MAIDTTGIPAIFRRLDATENKGFAIKNSLFSTSNPLFLAACVHQKKSAKKKSNLFWMARKIREKEGYFR